MSTTHCIALNGDLIARAEEDPHTFAHTIVVMCARSGRVSDIVKDVARSNFGIEYLAESMNGVDGAIQNAATRRR